MTSRRPPLRRRRARFTAGLAATLVLALPSAASASVAVFPSPGTPVASPATDVSFRGVSAAGVGSVSVMGSRSGAHPGHIVAHSDGGGASFVPDKPFADGEKVTVRTGLDVLGGSSGTFSFRVVGSVKQLAPFLGEYPTPAGSALAFKTRRDLAPPRLTVAHAATRAVAPGYLFYAPKVGPGQDGPTIADNSGQPVWFHPVKAPNQATDFRVQSYLGRPVLTWWQGQVRLTGTGAGQDVIVDSSYRTIARVDGANGFKPDIHEFLLGPNGIAWVTSYRAVHWDLSPVGGKRHGVALDSIVQGIDVRTGLAVFEWHSLGNVPVTDAYNVYSLPKAQTWDYFHVNSIDLDPSGDLIVGARNTCAVYRIDHTTGATVWRVGGKRPTLTMGPGTRFFYQHDARLHPDGTLTIFDDEASPPVQPQSRGITLRLDFAARTVTLVNPVLHHPRRLSAANQGNMQTLPGGDFLVGWGSNTWITEFGPAGDVLFDAHLPTLDQTYRVYRFPWVGHPSGLPKAAAHRRTKGSAVWASWNGATEVRTWRILGGSNPKALAPLVNAPRTGFETGVRVPSAGPYFAVQALDANHQVLGTSRVVKR